MHGCGHRQRVSATAANGMHCVYVLPVSVGNDSLWLVASGQYCQALLSCMLSPVLRRSPQMCDKMYDKMYDKIKQNKLRQSETSPVTVYCDCCLALSSMNASVHDRLYHLSRTIIYQPAYLHTLTVLLSRTLRLSDCNLMSVFLCLRMFWFSQFCCILSLHFQCISSEQSHTSICCFHR